MAPNTKINLSDKVDDGEMDLSMCDLQEVPVKEIAAYRKVWSLDLSNNHLVQLPKSFPTLTNLTKLDLSKNKLKKLPDNFGDLHRLKHLDLYKNELQHLPLSFGQLKNLKWLDLKDNPLVPAIQEAAGECLDTSQCHLCATNMIFFFMKLKEKVDEERDIREKQRLKEKEKHIELTAQKSKTQTAEKKKKKEPKLNQLQTKVKDEIAPTGECATITTPEKLEEETKRRRSFWFYFFAGFILFFAILFVLTAAHYEKTVLIEKIVAETWTKAMRNSHSTVQSVGNTIADYFVSFHRKVGRFITHSEEKSFFTYVNHKFQEFYGKLIT